MEYINLYKPLCKTPLETVLRFKDTHPEYKETKLAYAGRLDPMAEGVLLIVPGENIMGYLNEEKEYEATILFGLGTDTYDTLGVLNEHSLKELDEERVKKEINNMLGMNVLAYPDYSSVQVGGKPLLHWARRGMIDKVRVPKGEMEVKNIEIKEFRKVGATDLLDKVVKRADAVRGDFRQKEIIDSWKKYLDGADQNFIAVDVKMVVSAGTYIRAIAHELGIRVGSCAILLNLKRTRLGEHKIEDSIWVYSK
ncbi:MAG: hypothetical protein ACD_76C00021G0001 [uncultured bacterium]|nr:MAG: hypothetical protein ACD_76C00021G0001 [uncultured bacterium]HBD05054.1 hypothetical protein [Candidatus Uhrbacteria bacterium]